MSDIAVTQGQTVNISWNGDAPDYEATVHLGYDLDTDINNGWNGYITQGQPEDGTYPWYTTGISPGTYYIFGYFVDGQCDIIVDYSGAVTDLSADDNQHVNVKYDQRTDDDQHINVEHEQRPTTARYINIEHDQRSDDNQHNNQRYR